MEVQRLGERKLIKLIRSLHGYSWANSDSAYIDIGNKRMLITNDSITAKTHIPKGADPRDAGYFFAALNLSDIAAMGGTPKYFMSSMILPGSTDVRYLKDFELGVKKCLAKYHVKIIGGDLKKGAELAMTGIAIGEVKKSSMMQRLGIRAGQALCVTGELGDNAAGYYSWKNGAKNGAKRLLDIEPMIKEGLFLSGNGVKAAMDLSDGIYSAIRQLKDETGLGFDIYFGELPVSRAAKEAKRKYGISIEQLCLNFGGEYELIFTVNQSKFGALKAKAAKHGLKVTRIGKVTRGGNFIVKGGKRINISKYGYEHFITD